MTDPDFLNPPIEVIATSPRREMLMSRLKSAGLRPYDGRNDPRNEDPMLIDAASMTGAHLHQVKKQMARQTGRVVILLAGADAPLLQDAIILTHDSDLSTIPARLEVARRKESRLEEVRLRAQSAEELIGRSIQYFDEEPANVLFVGDGSSHYLALSAALKTLDVSVTASLTTITARDYLLERNFSCVLLNLDESSPSAMAFLRELTNDHMLASVPIFIMVRSRSERSIEQQAAFAAATEVINSDQPILELADTISMLAEFHKAATPMTPDLIENNRIKDRITGLFTSEYLEHHLQNQIDSTHIRPMSLSFLTLQMSSPSDGNTAARNALPELAKQILPEMRQTDCAGRINWSTIGISLRDTPYSGGVRLAQRLVDKLGGVALSKFDAPLGYGGSLSWRVIEKRSYHSAKDLFQAGTQGPNTRIVQAA